jgi:phthalate 4,5-cis-dihydrodiol dehydrogenase
MLRIGLAGLGVAATMLMPGIDAYPGAQIVAAADPRLSARVAFETHYRGGRAYADVEGLCTDPNVDAIWIATPNQMHCEHTIAAANHGKHVICTKPMALTIDECTRMCEAAESNGVLLLCGQTWSMSPDVRAMSAVAHSGDLGRIIAINTWMSTDWLIKPRIPEELDEAKGGGVVFRHAPHLIDTVRELGPGPLRSVRAMVGRWMPERPCPGNFTAYLEFEDGTPASIVYNGYGYFDTSELTWGIGNRWYTEEERIPIRRALRQATQDVAAAKEGMRFGAGLQHADSVGGGWNSPQAEGTRAHINWFGLTVVSCERGDVRQSPNGLFVYDDDGKREIPVTGDRGIGTVEVQELDEAIRNGTPLEHSGRWALGTLEIGVAFVDSARERREILLTHQTAKT